VQYPEIPETELRELAWRHCGISRSGEGLHRACETLRSVGFVPNSHASRQHYELRNIHTVAALIARCAFAREESRGGHYRSDYPEPRPEFQKHSLVSLGGEVEFA
jgi:L-aspartate oxidase